MVRENERWFDSNQPYMFYLLTKGTWRIFIIIPKNMTFCNSSRHCYPNHLKMGVIWVLLGDYMVYLYDAELYNRSQLFEFKSLKKYCMFMLDFLRYTGFFTISMETTC